MKTERDNMFKFYLREKNNEELIKMYEDLFRWSMSMLYRDNGSAARAFEHAIAIYGELSLRVKVNPVGDTIRMMEG